MNRKQAERLVKLMNHLYRGKLGHKKFDFSSLNKGGDFGKCGTAGCAVGECPLVFPRSWKFGDGGAPMLADTVGSLDAFYRCVCAVEEAEEFFGLTSIEGSHLFVPNSQFPKRFGGRKLGPRATREQVADNIKAFLKLKYPSVLKRAAKPARLAGKA